MLNLFCTKKNTLTGFDCSRQSRIIILDPVQPGLFYKQLRYRMIQLVLQFRMAYSVQCTHSILEKRLQYRHYRSHQDFFALLTTTSLPTSHSNKFKTRETMNNKYLECPSWETFQLPSFKRIGDVVLTGFGGKKTLKKNH